MLEMVNKILNEKRVVLHNAGEAIALENALRRQKKSFKTTITRSKKRGRSFLVELIGGVEKAVEESQC